MFADYDWIYDALAKLIASTAVLLLLWSLFWDRSRGRRRCPRCWYIMDGVPGLTCPECGRTARREGRLHRTRRRWRWCFATAVLLLAAYATSLVPVVVRDGWLKATPSAVLLIIAPMDDWAWKATPWPGFDAPVLSAVDPFLAELLGRYERRTLSRWQSRHLWSRLLRAQPDQRSRLGLTRDQWPRDIPVYVETGRGFLLSGPDTALRLRIRGAGRPWIECTPIEAFRSPGRLRNLGPPPVNIDRFEIEAEVIGVDATSNDPSSTFRLWSGSLKQVVVVESLSQILAPLPSSQTAADASAAIIAGLRPSLGRGDDGEVKLTMNAVPYHIGPHDIDWSLGARIEVLYAGRVVVTGHCLYPMHSPNPNGMYFGTRFPMDHTFDLEWVEPEPVVPLLDGRWTIRVSGDAAVAIRDVRRSIYWQEQITVPVTAIGPVRKGLIF